MMPFGLNDCREESEHNGAGLVEIPETFGSGNDCLDGVATIDRE